MISKRDPVAINNVGQYLSLCSDELKSSQALLNKHINDISTYYKGVEFNIIALKFLKASERINTITANLQYYSQYFKTLSEHDKENLELATKKFQEILDEVEKFDDSLLLDYLNNKTIKIDGVKYESK